MKKVLLLLLAGLLGSLPLAQASHPGRTMQAKLNPNPIKLKMGLVGTYNYNYIINRNIWLDDNQIPQLTPDWNLGIMGGIDFSRRVGLEANLLFGNFTQDIKTDFDTVNLVTGFQYRKVDVPVLLRVGKTFYMEFGPQFSFISNASHRLSDGVRGSDFATSYVSGVYGTGLNIRIGNVTLQGGVRFAMSLTDVEGTDGYGNILADETIYQDGSTSLNQGAEGVSADAYETYKKSFPVSGGVKVGLIYSLN